MAVTANSIVTPQALQTETAVATTANSTYTDSPTNSVLLVTAGANGARVIKITAIPRATVTATQLQLYRSPDAGTTKRFFDSEVMAAYTMAQTTQCLPVAFDYSEDNPLILEANERIYVAIGVTLASGIVFQAEWYDY